MKFVLIVIIMGYNTVSMQDFTSEETCTRAASVIASSGLSFRKLECVEK
jgi:hypothetical protein